jgi:CheY-like chemotaxis protein
VSSRNNPNEAAILLVEDRQGDVVLTRQAFTRANIPNPLYMVHDGAEAIDYLDGKGKFANRAEYPMPSLVFFGSKLAKVDGFELLRYVRGHRLLKGLPMVMLTASEDQKDIDRAYDLGANSFITKPADFATYAEMLKTTISYCLHISSIPGG